MVLQEATSSERCSEVASNHVENLLRTRIWKDDRQAINRVRS